MVNKKCPACYCTGNGAQARTYMGAVKAHNLLSTFTIACTKICASTSEYGLHPSILLTRIYYTLVLQSGALCFITKHEAKSISHSDHSINQSSSCYSSFWLSIGGNFCLLKSASDTISESQKSQKFPGSIPLYPPCWHTLCVREAQSTYNGFRHA